MQPIFQKEHPLKDETITVMLKPQYRKKNYPVYAKYRSFVNKDGELKEILVYLNGLGVQTMDMSDYIDMCNNIKQGDRVDKLNAKRFDFTAEIVHSSEFMHDQKEIGLDHYGLTLKGSDKITLADKIFWLNNPKCDINGVPNGIDTIFDVTVEGASKKKKMATMKEELEISNFVNSINDERMLSEVFHFFGLNPDGKSIDDMKLSLLKGDTEVIASGGKVTTPGILMSEQNANDFRNTFMAEGNEAKRLILGINKAKHYNFITLNTIQGNKGWYYNQSFLGTNDSELQSYFNSHPTVFDAILSKIERQEKSKYPVETKSMIPDAARIDTITERTNLLQELLSLIQAEKVTLPKDVLVSKLSDKELKEYVESGKKVAEVKEKVAVEAQETQSPTYFERQKEGEGKGEYRNRLIKALTVLVREGKVTLPEDTNRLAMKVGDMEHYLMAYEQSINKSSTENVGE